MRVQIGTCAVEVLDLHAYSFAYCGRPIVAICVMDSTWHRAILAASASCCGGMPALLSGHDSTMLLKQRSGMVVEMGVGATSLRSAATRGQYGLLFPQHAGMAPASWSAWSPLLPPCLHTRRSSAAAACSL